MKNSTRNLLILAAVGVGGYLVIRQAGKLGDWFRGVFEGIGRGAGDTAAGAWRFFNQPMQTTARIALPDGQLIPPERGEFLSVGDNTARWKFGGVVYTLGARQGSIYPAVRA